MSIPVDIEVIKGDGTVTINGIEYDVIATAVDMAHDQSYVATTTGNTLFGSQITGPRTARIEVEFQVTGGTRLDDRAVKDEEPAEEEAPAHTGPPIRLRRPKGD